MAKMNLYQVIKTCEINELIEIVDKHCFQGKDTEICLKYDFCDY